MTKKKKSILSDQRFIVLLVIIALSAVFSIMSKELSLSCVQYSQA